MTLTKRQIQLLRLGASSTSRPAPRPGKVDAAFGAALAAEPRASKVETTPAPSKRRVPILPLPRSAGPSQILLGSR